MSPSTMATSVHEHSAATTSRPPRTVLPTTACTNQRRPWPRPPLREPSPFGLLLAYSWSYCPPNEASRSSPRRFNRREVSTNLRDGNAGKSMLHANGVAFKENSICGVSERFHDPMAQRIAMLMLSFLYTPSYDYNKYP
ncbi:uncharacterized protein [Miscanthus floridulus]|uniref:uncharacterized protein isoform X2 n=1 Tax=Miscanthus floridulus TaxID=154761 RepID=UPI00345A2423